MESRFFYLELLELLPENLQEVLGVRQREGSRVGIWIEHRQALSPTRRSKPIPELP